MNKLDKMKISILTPSYNGDKYISRAIESVLKQDYDNFEHIVADGGSTDNTLRTLERYNHLKVWSKKDKGQSDAMNQAFAKSTGDLVMYLNVDDELAPGIFSYAIDYFKHHSNTDLLVMDLSINDRGHVSRRSPSCSLVEILQYWPARFPLNPVSYIYRRQLQVRIGPFPLDNHWSMDYWFLLRAYLFGRTAKGNFCGGTYHIDGENKSTNTIRGKASLRKVRNEFLLRYFYTPVVWRFFYRKIFGKLLHRNNKS